MDYQICVIPLLLHILIRQLYKSNRRDSNILLCHKRDRKCLVVKNALTKENECSIIGDRDKTEVVEVDMYKTINEVNKLTLKEQKCFIDFLYFCLGRLDKGEPVQAIFSEYHHQDCLK